MKTTLIKKREHENANWTNTLFGIIIGLVMICTILLMSNHLKAASPTNPRTIVPQVYEEMSGQTENGVNYETVYVGTSKFIVFKFSGDIEVVRAN